MKKHRVLASSLALSLVIASACSSDSTQGSDDHATADASSVDAAVVPGEGGTGQRDSGVAPGSDAGGPHTVVDSGVPTPGMYDVTTKLPSVPKLQNTVGVVNADSVSITFLPFDGARDYRVYELPKDGDVMVAGDQVHVRNATYRCAGQRQVPIINADATPEPGGIGARTLVDNQDVDGYKRTLAQAVLGYVYFAAGEGRTPVYALGDPAPKSDNWAFIARFSSTRTKRYTSSSELRNQLLAAGWRDDGVAFYVPSAAGANTQNIYTSLASDGHTRYYFGDGDEKKVRSGAELAFPVLSAKTDDSDTLYRVAIQKYQASSHDELVVGKTMFERVRFQGTDKPVTQLTWSGLSAQTTLVVEALDSVCPYAGRLAATPIAEYTEGAAVDSGHVTYPAAITIDQARAASATGELYINGQSADAHVPKAVARAFLQVSPQPHEQFDFFAGFEPGTSLPAFSETPCGTPSGNCFQQWRYVSSQYDLLWHTVATTEHALGNVLGQLWMRFADWAADTNGKMRLTPLQKGKVSSDSYLHVTMSVTSNTTTRRYPQIIVSDRDAPVQDFLDQGNTVIMQTFRNWPTYVELQVCDHRTWDVNNQCPFFQFLERYDSSKQVTSLAPIDEVGELTGADVPTRFDLFLSSKRAYLMMNQKPFGCVDLPAKGIPQGDVTVTYGDVLYHSAADAPLGYSKEFLTYDTERRFDNLGFSSNVPEPQWDVSRFPCVAASAIDIHR